MSERFTTEIPVRYSDVDTYGHVNNATYATYLEEARIDYLEALLGDEGLTSSVDDGRDHDRQADDGRNHDGQADDGRNHDGRTDDTESEDGAIGVVVANLEIDFRRSIETADAVTVAVAVGEMGTSSFTLEYEIRSADGVHASAETTMVAFDRQARESRPLPERWRTAVDEFDPTSAE